MMQSEEYVENDEELFYGLTQYDEDRYDVNEIALQMKRYKSIMPVVPEESKLDPHPD